MSYISHIYQEAPADPIVTKFGLGADFRDVINCALKSVHGFGFYSGSNFGLSHRNQVSPLTQGSSFLLFHSSDFISSVKIIIITRAGYS